MSIGFQLLPPLSPDEYGEMRDDISAHGVQVPIITTDKGEIVDGHHRAKIARELGVPCPETVVAGYADTELRSMAIRLNVRRRHLTREQCRELIRNSVKADPQLSNRRHAERTGTSPTTVGTVRASLENVGEVSKLDTRVDAKGVAQPATKPSAVTAENGLVMCDPRTGGFVDEPGTEPDPARAEPAVDDGYYPDPKSESIEAISAIQHEFTRLWWAQISGVDVDPIHKYVARELRKLTDEVARRRVAAGDPYEPMITELAGNLGVHPEVVEGDFQMVHARARNLITDPLEARKRLVAHRREFGQQQ